MRETPRAKAASILVGKVEMYFENTLTSSLVSDSLRLFLGIIISIFVYTFVFTSAKIKEVTSYFQIL